MDDLLASVRGAHTCAHPLGYEKFRASLCLSRETELHDHQQVALLWMAAREGSTAHGLQGGILADGPGLGKTLTMLSCIQLHASTAPTLVVVPNQIIAQQWLKDMSTHFKPHTWTACIFSPSEPMNPRCHIVLILMKDLTKEWSVVFPLGSHLSDLSRHRRQSELSERGRSVSVLYHVSWRRICVDEVQEILGKSSLAAQMIQQLEAPIRWGLSGTPVSKVVDIAGVAQFLQLAPYDSSHWWRKHGDVALSLVQPVLDDIVWRTPSHHVTQSLQLPGQTILPTTYVSMTAIEFAAYRPQFEKYIKDVRKRIANFEDNERPIAMNELRQVLNHPAVLGLCKGASHVSFLTKAKAISADFVANMTTRQREQCSSALSQWLESAISHAGDLETAYITWCEHFVEIPVPWLVQLKVFSALAEFATAGPIKYRHQVHRAVLDSRDMRLPAILWQRVFEFLHEDFSSQQLRLAHDHQAPLKAAFDAMSASFWADHGTESLDGFQNEVEASYHLEYRLPRPAMQELLSEFMSMRLSEAKSRVGIFERPTLWHYLRNKRSSNVDAAEIRLVTTDLLAQYIEQFSASLKNLYDLMHADWSAVLPRVLEAYGRCNHATRRMDRTLVVGREDRWQRRDAQHSQGRGQLALGPRCVVCSLRNRIDMAMSFLETEGKTPTLMLLFFTTDAPSHVRGWSCWLLKLWQIQAKLQRGTSTLQQLLSLATLLDNWLRASLEIQTCLALIQQGGHMRRVSLAHHKFRLANCYRNYTNAIAALDSSVATVACDQCRVVVPKTDIALLLCCHRFCPACCTLERRCALCQKPQPFAMTKAPPLPPHLYIGGSKMDAIVADLKAITPHDKCVVFSQYPEVLELLKTQLDDLPLPCVQLKSGNQIELRHQFQTHANIRVLLLPLKKYNHGLNLVEATHVFLLEPSLQPALHAQAMARVKRLNQTQPTFVHRYVMRDTVEEAVEAALTQPRRLTKADIFRIFAHDTFESQ
ncbi:Aste57867_4669 [Aphanomyces stellatus]|uniref:Aste57867_4669 protein n=1 Tax=Aphanomyces stellatus TaxID=120398 RepID=A0A485KD23_9STRA|nr:hypothetical protein As57867_004656 [Aphanomyces stellatus]VFT81772.1 Aste57867_4669 [Aphanomyces stellatus]